MEKQNNLLSDKKIPVGLGMALAENMQSLQIFAGMSNAMQQEVINRTHEMNSSADMKQFVSSLQDESWRS